MVAVADQALVPWLAGNHTIAAVEPLRPAWQQERTACWAAAVEIPFPAAVVVAAAAAASFSFEPIGVVETAAADCHTAVEATTAVAVPPWLAVILAGSLDSPPLVSCSSDCTEQPVAPLTLRAVVHTARLLLLAVVVVYRYELAMQHQQQLLHLQQQ